MRYPYFIVFIVSCSIISSCTVLFKNPQPCWIKNPETSFSTEILGKYVFQIDSLTHDTMNITSDGFTTKFCDNKITISDSLILRRDEDYYYLNMRCSSFKKWDVFIIKKDADTLSFLVLLPDDTIITKLKSITQVKSMRKGIVKRYCINPNPQQFKEILDKKLFSQFQYRKI